jgi:hypothetical protein
VEVVTHCDGGRGAAIEQLPCFSCVRSNGSLRRLRSQSEFVTLVHYVYGDQLKHAAGQARRRKDLAALADTLSEFQVYVVEVCRRCNWNFLVEQLLLGRNHSAATATSPTGTV